MEEKKQKILFGAIIILLMTVIGLVVWQQITIGSLKKKILTSIAPTPQEEMAMEDQGIRQPADLVKAVVENLLAGNKQIVGRVAGIDGETISIESEIVDFNKLPFAESLEPDKLPKTKKTFSVKISEKTEFRSAKLANIEIGGQIQVFTDDSIYETDRIEATKINYPYDEDAASGQKFVSGKIKEIKNDTLSLAAYSKEGKETGTYSVKIRENTKFIKRESADKESVISFSDLKNGDSVLARAADPIGDRTEFEAMGIEIIVLPPKE